MVMLNKLISKFCNETSALPGSILRRSLNYYQLIGPQKFKQESPICNVRQISILTLFNLRGLSRVFHSPILRILSGHSMASHGSNKSSSSTPGHENSGSSNNQPGKSKFSTTKEELKARLSPIQYQVTQLKSTERPGSGEYNKFNKKGTYHCVVCDQELFKSETKYESGCGWPAFYDAASERHLKFVRDSSLVSSANLLLLASKADLVRTEVLCNNCDAHLGHRFDDGPISKGGKRYCINSAALRFEPAIGD